MKVLIRGLTALTAAGLLTAPVYGEEADFACQFLRYDLVKQQLCYLGQDVVNLRKQVKELQRKTRTY